MSALLFDDANPDRLTRAAAVVTAEPFTLASWFRTNDGTAGQTIISVAAVAAGGDHHRLQIQPQEAGEPLKATSLDRGVTLATAELGGVVVDQWHHGAAIFAATNDRRVFLDGAKATNATTVTVTGLDETNIARHRDFVTAPTEFFSGRLAWPAVWDVALTDFEIGLLADGAPPWKIRPGSIVSLPRLVSAATVPDFPQRTTWTIGGAPTVAMGPPVSVSVHTARFAAAGFIVGGPVATRPFGIGWL